MKTILWCNPYNLRLFKSECMLKVNKQTTPKNRLCWLTGWISVGYLELEESLHLPDLGLKGSWWSLSSLETNRKAIEPLKVLLLTENYDVLMRRCSGGSYFLNDFTPFNSFSWEIKGAVWSSCQAENLPLLEAVCLGPLMAEAGLWSEPPARAATRRSLLPLCLFVQTSHWGYLCRAGPEWFM